MAKRVTRLGGLLAAYQRRDPAARSKLEIFLLYPGVHAVLYHRAAHWLFRRRFFFLARCVSRWVGSGAKVLGPFTVGDNARIAAGAVVLREVPPNCTAVGVPARVVRCAGQPVFYADDVDQIHMADPVLEELTAMSERLEQLEEELYRLKNRKGMKGRPA